MAKSENYPSWLNPLYVTSSCKVMFTSRGVDSVMSSPYGGFNMCHYTGDDPGHVLACRKEFTEYLGIDDASLAVPRQIHSANVSYVGRIPVDVEKIEGVDALVTDMKNVVIGVSTADCVPVVAVDERAGIAGVAHAGWRGALGGVIDALLDEMVAVGASMRSMKAFFGPSICADCFEVGEEVASLFPEQHVVRCGKLGKANIDLTGYVYSLLMARGMFRSCIVPFKNDLCTKCHPDKFYSARASGLNSGRNFTFVVLK